MFMGTLNSTGSQTDNWHFLLNLPLPSVFFVCLFLNKGILSVPQLETLESFLSYMIYFGIHQ